MITCLPSRFLARAKSSALSAPRAPVEKPFTPPAWMIMMSLSHSKFCSKCCSQYRSLEPSTTGSLLPSADTPTIPSLDGFVSLQCILPTISVSERRLKQLDAIQLVREKREHRSQDQLQCPTLR